MVNLQIADALSEARDINRREAFLLLDTAMSCQWDETEREEDGLPEFDAVEPDSIHWLNIAQRRDNCILQRRFSPEPSLEDIEARYDRQRKQEDAEKIAAAAAEVRWDAAAARMAAQVKAAIKREVHRQPIDLINDAAKALYFRLGKGKGYFVKGRRNVETGEYTVQVFHKTIPIGELVLDYICSDVDASDYDRLISEKFDLFEEELKALACEHRPD